MFAPLIESIRLEAKRKKTLRSLERKPRWAKNQEKLRRRYQGQARMSGEGEVGSRRFANKNSQKAVGWTPGDGAKVNQDVRKLRGGLKK